MGGVCGCVCLCVCVCMRLCDSMWVFECKFKHFSLGPCTGGIKEEVKQQERRIHKISEDFKIFHFTSPIKIRDENYKKDQGRTIEKRKVRNDRQCDMKWRGRYLVQYGTLRWSLKRGQGQWVSGSGGSVDQWIKRFLIGKCSDLETPSCIIFLCTCCLLIVFTFKFQSPVKISGNLWKQCKSMKIRNNW